MQTRSSAVSSSHETQRQKVFFQVLNQIFLISLEQFCVSCLAQFVHLIHRTADFMALICLEVDMSCRIYFCCNIHSVLQSRTKLTKDALKTLHYIRVF